MASKDHLLTQQPQEAQQESFGFGPDIGRNTFKPSMPALPLPIP
jgi:hypothetical protein